MSPKRKQYAQQRGVYERKPGTDVWWIRYVDQYGRLHRERIGPHNLAVQVYQKRKAEVAEGTFFPEKKRDVFLSVAVKAYVEGKKSARSRKDLERYGKFWTAELGERTLRGIKVEDVQAALRKLPPEISKQTRRHYLTALRSVYLAAISSGTAERVPILKSMWPNVANERVRYLRDEEEDALCEHMKPADFDVALFAIHTGLRQEEQFRLKWSQVDFKAEVVSLPKTKTGKARYVHLSATALAILRRTPRLLHSPWVFNSRRRKGGKLPLNARWFTRKVFLPAIAAARIEDFTWHDLRHTFASRLVMAGVDISTVQDLMGHASTQMTRRYAHLSPEHKGRAVRVLNGKHGAAAKGAAS